MAGTSFLSSLSNRTFSLGVVSSANFPIVSLNVGVKGTNAVAGIGGCPSIGTCGAFPVAGGFAPTPIVGTCAGIWPGPDGMVRSCGVGEAGCIGGSGRIGASLLATSTLGGNGLFHFSRTTVATKTAATTTPTAAQRGTAEGAGNHAAR